MTPVIEPDLQALSVKDDAWTPVAGTGLEYASIGDNDSDYYAVRDMTRPAVEVRRPGDDFRKLGAVLGRGTGAEVRDDDLHTFGLDDRYERVEGTGLEYTRINDHDAYSVRDRDPDVGGEIRRPGDDWRTLGSIL